LGFRERFPVVATASQSYHRLPCCHPFRDGLRAAESVYLNQKCFSYILASCVEGEIEEVWDFIAKDNPEAAGRVVTAIEKTFQLLADNPGPGRPRKFKSLRLRNLRFRPVPGFEKYLVFYQEIPGGIEVFHVYHAARNIDALMRRR
jgi:toxin ParE1/3/4